MPGRECAHTARHRRLHGAVLLEASMPVEAQPFESFGSDAEDVNSQSFLAWVAVRPRPLFLRSSVSVH